jgi:hypothetical protein
MMTKGGTILADLGCSGGPVYRRLNAGRTESANGRCLSIGFDGGDGLVGGSRTVRDGGKSGRVNV